MLGFKASFFQNAFGGQRRFAGVRFFKIYGGPLLSGLLLGLSFVPFPFFTLFFALIPLWLFIYRQSSWKKLLIACLLCQFVSAFTGFNWMIYTFHHFGGMNWYVSAILLAGFCFLPSLSVTAAGLMWFFVVRKSPVPLPVSARLLLFPLFFSLFHSLLPGVFPWNMGYPWLWGGMPGAQTAELWGFRFLHTLFYVFNLLLMIVFKHCDFARLGTKIGAFLSLKPFGATPLKPQNKTKSPVFFPRGLWKRLFRPLATFRKNSGNAGAGQAKGAFLDSIGKKALLTALLLFAGLNGLGLLLKKRLATPDRLLQALVVQNNIGSTAYLDPKPFKTRQKKALHISKSLTFRAVFHYAKHKSQREGIGFILWPEGAYPYPIPKSATQEKPLSRMVRSLKIPLVTGGTSQDAGRYANSLFVFDREGQILQPVYDKIKLLIFGEYFPGMRRFPFLRKLFPYFGAEMTPGKEVQTLPLEGVFLGWQICYEGLFDSLSRRLAQKGAQVLVNVTNDSWYGSWQEPYQHLTMSLARAIEIRRPLIRATNTGRSAVIQADGQLIPLEGGAGKFSPMNKAWFQLYKIPYYSKPPKSLFVSWGYYINEIFLTALAFLIIALLFLPSARQGKRKQR